MPLSLTQTLRQLANRFTQYLMGNKAQLDFEQLIQDGVLHVGRHTYGWPVIEAYQGSEAKVWIGNFCSISKDVVFVTGGIHPLGWVSTYPFRIRWNLPGKYEDGMPGTKGDILVGSDVWIGTGAMILSGVKIGDGAVVAARSVVTRDVPPFAVVGGVPARVIRYRFDPETIDCLLQMKWWEWDDETLRENIHFLSSDNVAGFIQSWKESRSAE